MEGKRLSPTEVMPMYTSVLGAANAETETNKKAIRAKKENDFFIVKWAQSKRNYFKLASSAMANLASGEEGNSCTTEFK